MIKSVSLAIIALAYWVTGCHLFFTTYDHAGYLLGIFTIEEMTGLLFLMAAMAICLYLEVSKGA